MCLYKENNRSTALFNYCGFSNIHWTQFVVNFLLHVTMPIHRIKSLSADIFFLQTLMQSSLHNHEESVNNLLQKNNKERELQLELALTQQVLCYIEMLLTLSSYPWAGVTYSLTFISFNMIGCQSAWGLFKKKTIIQMLLVIYMCVWSSKWLISTHFKQYQ